jgi:phosphatidylglycerol:prolipoprotein diacylglycerol transferase
MLLFLTSFHPSPVVSVLGPFVVRWYGVTLAIGALLAFFVIRRLGTRRGWTPDAPLFLFIVTFLVGFVAARLYHVLNEPGYYLANPLEILKVWHGGLAIHGGIIGGVGALWYVARKWRVPLLSLTDIVAPALAIGQAIGRWGNYFNQELFGRPTDLPWKIPIDPANRPPGYEAAEWFHPTFLYESLWAFALFIVLMVFAKRRLPVGVITFVYLGVASLGRFGTEMVRIDDTPILYGVRLPLLVSAALVVVGALGLWYRIKRPKNDPSVV